MNTDQRRTKVSGILLDSTISQDEKLELIERIYAEYSEAALLCLHAASVAGDKDDDEGQYSALADAADVLTYAINGAEIVISKEHQDIIHQANRFALEAEEL